MQANDISDIIAIIKLKNYRREEPHIDDPKRSRNQRPSHKNVGTSTNQPLGAETQKKSQLPDKMKSLYNKYVLGKELELEPDSFKDEVIWGKITELSMR